MAKGTKDFFEENPGARAMEKYNKCTSRQMLFVCLVADRDWDAPLRTLPERQRRERAVILSGYPMEGTRPDKNGRNLIAGKVESVEKAIEQYREDQYDEERVMLDAITAQIQETLDTMASNKEELAKRIKTKTDKDGNTEIETFIDAKQLSILKMEAVKLSEKLPALRAAKKALLEGMKIETSVQGEFMSHTSQDLSPEDEAALSDSSDDAKTHLDIINEKRFRELEQ
jgi:hypothetical protein